MDSLIATSADTAAAAAAAAPSSATVRYAALSADAVAFKGAVKRLDGPAPDCSCRRWACVKQRSYACDDRPSRRNAALSNAYPLHVSRPEQRQGRGYTRSIRIWSHRNS